MKITPIKGNAWLIGIIFVCFIIGCNNNKNKKVSNDFTEHNTSEMATYNLTYYPFCFPFIKMQCFIPKQMHFVRINYSGSDSLSTGAKYVFSNYCSDMLVNKNSEYMILEIDVQLMKYVNKLVENNNRNEMLELLNARVRGSVVDSDYSSFQGNKMPVYIITCPVRDSRKYWDSIHGWLNIHTYIPIDGNEVSFDYKLETSDSNSLAGKRAEILYMLHHLKRLN